MAAEKPKDLGPLMFAVRDTPQDSTRLTPFDLLIWTQGQNINDVTDENLDKRK